MADTTPQPRDDHAKQLKQAASTVKQLRGWMASDPTRTEEFVDALNQATGLRVLSRAWAEAFTEASEAVSAADRLVASRGPVGPYTPVVDAARYVTALTHVAAIQSGMNLAAPAGNTVEAAFSWKDQLTRPGLGDELLPRTVVWALLVRARAQLAAGDLAGANAWADAALEHARSAGLAGDETPVLLDALRTDADARWAVGLSEQSIELLREAVGLWESWTRDALAQLPRMAKPHLERLVTPMVALRRDLADRLDAVGRADEAAQVREAQARLLHNAAGRRGEPGRVDEALARADQAWSLADAGRIPEAQRAAEAATSALQALFKLEKPVGQHLPTQALVASSVAHVELAAGQPDRAERTINALFSRLQAHRQVVVGEPARALALLVRAQVREAQGTDGAAADGAEADQLLVGLDLGAGRSGSDPLAIARAAARGTQLRTDQPTPHWNVPQALAAFAPEGTAPTAVESDEEAMRRIDEVREAEARERAVAELRDSAARAQREREEAEARAAALARLEQEQAERERLEAQRLEEERVRAEEAEAQRREAERLAVEQREAARVEAERLQAEQQQVREAEAARQAAEREQAERIATEQARQAEAERLAVEQREAARAEQERAEQERAAQERAAQQAELERQQAEQLAAERAEQERLEQERRAAQQAAADRAAEQERRDAEQRAEALRVAEQQRVAAAEAERERAEAERQRRDAEVAEQHRQEQERQEQERQEQERAAREAEQQRLDEERRKADEQRRALEQAELARADRENIATEAVHDPVAQADPLERLRTEAHRALASGDKQRIVGTHEALAEALEPSVAADPQGAGRELVATLERLSDAQGWLRGRAAGRRAKQLAKDLGIS